MYFIVEDCPKGLCNSMWAGLNIYAYCLQHCYSVSIPAFEKHQKLFERYSIIEKLINIRRIKSWKELSENSNKHFIENREFIRTKIFPYSTATNENKWSEILIDNFGEKIIIGGDEISDLWGLANSNWIIGPPSTFSMFASFWKNTPLRIMLSPKDYNDLFMPEDHILALNIFSSGKHLIDENGIDFKLES